MTGSDTEVRTMTATHVGPALQLGVDSLCWNRQIADGSLSLEDTVRDGARAGSIWFRLHQNHVDPADVQGSLERIRDSVAERGQSIIWSGDNIGQSDTHSVADVVGHIEREIVKAGAVDAALIQFYANWFRNDRVIVRDGTAREVAFTSEVLAAVVPLLEDAALTLALENHSNFTSHEMLEVIGNVASDRVRIYLDVANPWPVHEDVVEAVARMAPLSVAVDVKDLYVESRWASNRWHRKGFDVIYTWPGVGILPWQRIWHALGENLPPIDVPLVIEGLSEDEDPLAGIEECVAFMRALEGPSLDVLTDER